MQMARNPTVMSSHLYRGSGQPLPDVLRGPKRSHLREMPALGILHLLRKTLVPGVVTSSSFHSSKLYKQDLEQAKKQKQKNPTPNKKRRY